MGFIDSFKNDLLNVDSEIEDIDSEIKKWGDACYFISKYLLKKDVKELTAAEVIMIYRYQHIDWNKVRE